MTVVAKSSYCAVRVYIMLIFYVALCFISFYLFFSFICLDNSYTSYCLYIYFSSVTIFVNKFSELLLLSSLGLLPSPSSLSSSLFYPISNVRRLRVIYQTIPIKTQFLIKTISPQNFIIGSTLKEDSLANFCCPHICKKPIKF